MEERDLTLALRLTDLVKELKCDWEYLSEERDRWGRTFRFDPSITTREPGSTESLIVEHLTDFEQLYGMAVRAGLDKHPTMSDVLASGLEFCRRIKGGELLSYSVDGVGGLEAFSAIVAPPVTP